MDERSQEMNLLLIIVAIVAVILLLTGGLVQSLNFLLWVGIVLAIIAVILFLMRSISGRRSV
jgi:preprotein translocase subunit SecF